MSNEIDNVSENGFAENEQTYTVIRNSVITAQSKIYTAVNSAMAEAYWKVGEQIYLACGENDSAGYGKGLVKYLFERLTAEFGKGFTVADLRNIRQFYLTYLKCYTLCSNSL